MMIPKTLTAPELASGYRAGKFGVKDVVEELYARIASLPDQPVWIHLLPKDTALARATELEQTGKADSLPLYGIPFAIKDNIDVAGLPTTAGCPAYSHVPDVTATVVRKLLDAGAILIGKTNMDQFATGLVGVRSPYGACSSVFNKEYLSGGSSSGSAVAVAAGLVCFSLGTDTAGSGRVPAAFNNLIGTKPTRGRISAAGVVPACKTLDCVSIFSHDTATAAAVLRVAEGHDSADSYSRAVQTASAPWLAGGLRIGVPKDLEFFGDDGATALYADAVERCKSLGWQIVEVDYTPFQRVAALLYSGPWVAERLAAVGKFLGEHASEADPTVNRVISSGAAYSAVDGFNAQYELERLRGEAAAEWAKMDVLLLPTTGTIYRIEDVNANPVQLNTNLGYYTNFVNLLDLAAVAAPAGFRANGLPFGISFIGPAFSDFALLELARRFNGESTAIEGGYGSIEVGVVGAHLLGEPLNWQLTQRGARLVKTCKTAGKYRFYALRDTQPPKPGLVREDGFAGTGIEVEVWAVPQAEFGSFVAAIPPPLGIGTLVLEDGAQVKGFICEPFAVAGSLEITGHGGWRNYLKSR